MISESFRVPPRIVEATNYAFDRSEMLRALLVVGLALSTAATADAKDVKSSFRGSGHAHASAEPHLSAADPGAAAATAGVARSTIGFVVPLASIPTQEPAAPAFASTAKPVSVLEAQAKVSQPTAGAGHWCDNGSIVGTGKGFCVLSANMD